MTMKTFSAIIIPYKQPNERSYLLEFLTPVMVVIDYVTMMSFIVVIILLKTQIESSSVMQT